MLVETGNTVGVNRPNDSPDKFKSPESLPPRAFVTQADITRLDGSQPRTTQTSVRINPGSVLQTWLRMNGGRGEREYKGEREGDIAEEKSDVCEIDWDRQKLIDTVMHVLERSAFGKLDDILYIT